jgi:hypothetical protein
MLNMAESEDNRYKPYILNCIIVILIFTYLLHVVFTMQKYNSLSSLKYDLNNIIFKNMDTTILFAHYSYKGLSNSVYLYLFLFVLTILLLCKSFIIRRSISTFLLIIYYILMFFIMVYPYFYLIYTQKSMFLTSTHFLLLTSYINDYSLYIFIPYYSILIGLTLYFVFSQTPLKRLRLSK